MSKLAYNFFKKKNISISQANINLIINKCNGDREALLNELNKIEHYVKKGKKISSDEIIKLTNLNENGPWGRPDMAVYLFADAISKDRPIKVFNNGNMNRDFTYIDDIVNGIEILLANPPEKKSKKPAYRISNIGNGSPQSLGDFIKAIETSFGIEAKKEFLPMQAGDVPQTWADVSDIEKLGYKSTIGIDQGVHYFVLWYKKFYNC